MFTLLLILHLRLFTVLNWLKVTLLVLISHTGLVKRICHFFFIIFWHIRSHHARACSHEESWNTRIFRKGFGKINVARNTLIFRKGCGMIVFGHRVNKRIWFFRQDHWNHVSFFWFPKLVSIGLLSLVRFQFCERGILSEVTDYQEDIRCNAKGRKHEGTKDNCADVAHMKHFNLIFESKRGLSHCGIDSWVVF